MELREGIKHIFDENAVVIMGAGASYGAKNAFGSMPSGKELSQYLYSKCDIKPDDPWDLQDAAQTYEEQFGPARLISEIRSIINCASFTSSHADIYSLPWIRYYTTNYDDVALLAASSRGKTIEPVTVTSEFYGNQEKRNVCVHINGYIGKLTSDTLHHEFKLTANSYQAQENILNSQWGVLFENDLETAKCIVIIGLSLKYDLDLRRIIYNSALREKTIIIDSPGLTENSENQLKRFGTVYKIGVDKFAEEIRNIGKIYLVNHREPKDKCYYAFTYESNMKYDLVSPSPDVIFRFYINGQFDNSLLYRNSGQYSGCVQRECNAEIKRAFTLGKRFVFVHSDMGNGKTVCINEIRYSMLEEGYYIFTLTNADSSKLREDIAAICLLAKEKKVLVIIDDYINYMEVLRIFTLNSEGKEQFLLTARSALNYNKMPTVFSMFSVEENQSAIFDINVLNNTELTNCVSIFDRNGLFGRNSGLNKNEKIRHLSARKYGARRFQSIMLDVLESEVIKRKISELIQIIRKQSQSYHDVIALILLKEVMNLRLRTRDIGRIGGIDISTDALFKTNPAIMELLSFNNGGEITIKSPITARYILQKTISPDTIITSLENLVHYAINYSETDKYSNILTSVISYSHICSILKIIDNPKQFMIDYYDQLSRIDFFNRNNFFWLQYAISCIETHRYDRAQMYLETAYGLIPENFVPFQINNQQARLYLEKIDSNNSKNEEEDLLQAHKLLMIPVVSKRDNEYNVVRLFTYYCRKKIMQVIVSKSKDKRFTSMYQDAYKRTAHFLKRHPEYSNKLDDLCTNLMKMGVQFISTDEGND